MKAEVGAIFDLVLSYLRMLDGVIFRLTGMSLATLTLLIIVICVIFIVITVMTLRFVTPPHARIIRYDSELSFKDPRSGNVVDFPSIFDDPALELSVIVPAYNETKRLPKMLDECFAYLQERSETSASRFRFEIIIIDDGSRDGTTALSLAYSKEYGTDKLRVLTLAKNRGKGGAVRLGVMSARGKFILFADADGATRFSDLERLEQIGLSDSSIKIEYDKPFIVCGSRAHLERDAIAARSLFRTFLMKVFHVFVYTFGDRGIKDTQCGFKLFTRRAAQLIFPALHVERWAFDVEAIKIARIHRIPVKEVPVHWTEIEGSHIVPIFSWLQIGKDLLIIWFKYAFGVWKVSTQRAHRCHASRSYEANNAGGDAARLSSDMSTREITSRAKTGTAGSQLNIGNKGDSRSGSSPQNKKKLI